MRSRGMAIALLAGVWTVGAVNAAADRAKNLSSTFAVLTLSPAREGWATGSFMVKWQPTHRVARLSSTL
jgi:hypothetical protein